MRLYYGKEQQKPVRNRSVAGDSELGHVSISRDASMMRPNARGVKRASSSVLTA
jgi:hypothetical protein